MRIVDEGVVQGSKYGRGKSGHSSPQPQTDLVHGPNEQQVREHRQETSHQNDGAEHPFGVSQPPWVSPLHVRQVDAAGQVDVREEWDTQERNEGGLQRLVLTEPSETEQVERAPQRGHRNG